jgi:hypothetical protein
MRKLLCALLALLPRTASAERGFITEFGAGYKNERSTSIVMMEDCHEVWVVRTKPDRPDLNYRPASCGGDNPIFVGWPIAYEWSIGDVYRLRTGWFHYSHWFDGSKGRETHMDALAITLTVKWREVGK